VRGDVVALAAGAVIVMAGGAPTVALALCASVLTAGGFRIARSRQARGGAAQRRHDVVEMCDAMAAELRAGQPAPRALCRVAEHHPYLARAARAARLGGDVPAALEALAAEPGASGLGIVAAAWRVADRSGAGLAVVLDRASDALRSDQAAVREVEASLGPPRATARMLAALPLLGLLLGAGIGGDPLAFLLGSAAGNGCLVVGSGLALLGVWWVERLAEAVHRR
jgi:tight adherence protein B